MRSLLAHVLLPELRVVLDAAANAAVGVRS